MSGSTPGSGGGATLTRVLRPSRSNLLAELNRLDENVSAHVEHMNNQLTSLIDMVGKLEDAEHTGTKKRLFQLRKKKSSGQSSSASGSKPSSAGSERDRASPVMSTISSQDIDMDQLSGSLAGMAQLSNSNPSLNSISSSGRPVSLPADGSLLRVPRGVSAQEGNSKEDILQHAQDIIADLGNMNGRYTKQRDLLKLMIENESKTNSLQPQVGLIASLRQSLNTTLQQNTMLRSKLARIHAESDLGDIPTMSMPQDSTLTRGINGSLSYSSSCISEFFDAREYADSGEETDDDISDSDLSDTAESGTEEDDNMFLEATASTITPDESQEKVCTMTMTGRRHTLPVPKTETEGVNLWNLLCKNIGKDLSKISMPVTLNEPLSTLQRLCEELEYSELLEKAVNAETALERLQWVVAFSISSYGSCNARASHKPFNPLLGETFECVRDDKGFRFVSEQVSHHPPISVAHATGAGWEWEQSLRIRSKFWGKWFFFSFEFRSDPLSLTCLCSAHLVIKRGVTFYLFLS